MTQPLIGAGEVDGESSFAPVNSLTYKKTLPPAEDTLPRRGQRKRKPRSSGGSLARESAALAEPPVSRSMVADAVDDDAPRTPLNMDDPDGELLTDAPASPGDTAAPPAELPVLPVRHPGGEHLPEFVQAGSAGKGNDVTRPLPISAQDGLPAVAAPLLHPGPPPRPANRPDPHEAQGTLVVQLQSELHEKDELIVTLTERLEQAAEQLDRLHRSGADRGLRRGGSSSSLPTELLADHRAALAEFSETVHRWEEMQAGMTLGRLETQISELRDLVTQLVHNGPQGAGEEGGSDRGHGSHGGSSAAVVTASRKPTNTSWWETQKAALLGDALPEPAAAASTPAMSSVLAVPDDDLLEQVPASLDYDTLTLDDARQALRERDQLVDRLRQALLLRTAAAEFPADLHSLHDLPEPLQKRLQQLEAQWEAVLRKTEMDLSLERARLTRETAALKIQQDQVRKQLIQLGVTNVDQADVDQVAALQQQEVDAPKRRWFRFLSRKVDNPGSPGKSSAED